MLLRNIEICYVRINKKYKLDKLLPHVTTRYHRKSLERVIGCIIQKEKTKDGHKSKFGNISTFTFLPLNFVINKNRF